MNDDVSIADSQIDSIALGASGPVVLARPSGFLVWRDCAFADALLDFATSERVATQVARQLLSGCLYSSWNTSPSTAEIPEDRMRRYVYSLCSMYQTTHVTPATLRRAKRRFLELGDVATAAFVEHKAVEETNHDILALRDLKAMGLPGEELVARIIPQRARSLVTLFDELAATDLPYGVLGYIYVLERVALRTTREDIDTIRHLAPDGVNITRCVVVHSAEGADATHVAEIIDYIGTLPRELRAIACRAVYRAGAMISADNAADPARWALDRLLDEWEWQPFRGIAH
ncbi:MAG: hypothetical protein H6974_10800 [Gammaproteobacteria bacterium]|nr:hypothetical protein [Gammaproteobacteria bacterium]